ncbi:MAG: hypothetical protein ACFCU1_11630 [Sumerlaeia bacterium]
MSNSDSTAGIDLETKVRKSLDLMRPYLQADGVKTVFEFIRKTELFISIESEKKMSAAELFMIKLGVEKKIMEQHKEIESVDLV